MLRVEKKFKSQGVGISLRESSHVLTPTFARALSFALLIHAIGITFFYIAPNKLGQTETRFPPTHVQIDMSFTDCGVLAALEKDKIIVDPIIQAPLSEPRLPKYALTVCEKDTAYPTVSRIARYPFEEHEAAYYHQDFFDFALPEKRGVKPIKIKLLGGLSDKAFVIENGSQWRKMMHELSGGKAKEYAVAYRIKVDDRTGKVFWYQPTGQPERKKVQNIAEKVLSLIRFEKKRLEVVENAAIQPGFFNPAFWTGSKTPSKFGCKQFPPLKGDSFFLISQGELEMEIFLGSRD